MRFNAINLPIEANLEAADPATTQFRAMRPHQLIDWLEQEQEEAEISHLRRQVRTTGRIGMMEAY
jgi:hypothetical protein